ncbi:hypothetical protein IMZ48_34350 [Candidatus Bathyarchaeota archaeon]|nr:hypothetical protein [Candidatus Bathyarchaeota archaeon]
MQQLHPTLTGCADVVGKIELSIRKYQQEGAWTRTKWVTHGRGYMEGLRSSLESFKATLTVGLDIITM